MHFYTFGVPFLAGAPWYLAILSLRELVFNIIHVRIWWGVRENQWEAYIARLKVYSEGLGTCVLELVRANVLTSTRQPVDENVLAERSKN